MSTPVTPAALALLLRQIAAAHAHAVPVHEVLELLAQEPVFAAWQAPLAALANAVRSGMPLATAMRAQPANFAPTLVEAIAAAEARGCEVEVLSMLADDYDHLASARLRLKTVLSWPITLAVLVLVLMINIAIFVIPGFREVYADAGGELPAITRGLFALLNPQSLWMWLAIGLVAAALVATAAGWWPHRLRALSADGFGRLPFVAPYLNARLAHRIARAWQCCGTDAELRRVVDLHLSATTTPPRLGAALGAVQVAVGQGAGLAQACAAQPLLPPRLGLYVRLAERLQAWPQTMAQLATLAANDEQAALARFERGLVLLSYAVLGTGVGFALMAVYLPIFRLGALF
jgi:type IV pilus assembly protein PilC